MKKIALILGVVLITVFLGLNAQTKYVTIDQKLSTGQQVGVLKKWEGSNWSNPFSPGAGFSFSINSDQTILGDQTIHSNQKYNNWRDNFSNVKNHQAHTIKKLNKRITLKLPSHRYRCNNKNQS